VAAIQMPLRQTPRYACLHPGTELEANPE